MPETIVSAAATGLPKARPNLHVEAAQVIAELAKHMTLAGVGGGTIKFEVELDPILFRRFYDVYRGVAPRETGEPSQRPAAGRCCKCAHD